MFIASQSLYTACYIIVTLAIKNFSAARNNAEIFLFDENTGDLLFKFNHAAIWLTSVLTNSARWF